MFTKTTLKMFILTVFIAILTIVSSCKKQETVSNPNAEVPGSAPVKQESSDVKQVPADQKQDVKDVKSEEKQKAKPEQEQKKEDVKPAEVKPVDADKKELVA